LFGRKFLLLLGGGGRGGNLDDGKRGGEIVRWRQGERGMGASCKKKGGGGGPSPLFFVGATLREKRKKWRCVGLFSGKEEERGRNFTHSFCVVEGKKGRKKRKFRRSFHSPKGGEEPVMSVSRSRKKKRARPEPTLRLFRGGKKERLLLPPTQPTSLSSCFRGRKHLQGKRHIL